MVGSKNSHLRKLIFRTHQINFDPKYTMSINEIQDEIIAEFADFEDWMDRYSLLIDYGNGLEPFPEEARTEQNLIDGCQSKVWFTARVEDGKIICQGDSDAILAK